MASMWNSWTTCEGEGVKMASSDVDAESMRKILR